MARKGMNIYKRKDGRWEGRYKDDVNSKYRSVYGKTYAETRDKLMKCRRQEPRRSEKCPLTVKELFELWLSSVNHRIKVSSYVNYLMKLELHIYPVLGAVTYETLASRHIDDFIRMKLDNGRIGGGSLSPRYVTDMVALLKCLGRFVEREFGYRNHMQYVNMPKNQPRPLNVPTTGEQEMLMKYLLKYPTTINMGILLCLFTGIRLGELCSLKWSDIDFSEAVIKVNTTIQRMKRFDGKTKTELVITPPKSPKSIREIPLPPFFIPLLKKIRRPPECFVLGGNLKPVEPRLMQYHFRMILKRAGLRTVNFHMLRHIFATNCISCGFDVKTLSEILGHSTVEMTLNRYVHTSRERKRECMGMLKLIA